MTNQIHRKILLAPFLLGITSYLLTVGMKPLNPNYIGWLLGRLDPTQHYLGWVFFRRSNWQWPLGINPDYGLGISSSIVYSDSIPLLALFFKPFSSLLPDPFQYFGIWLLLCFILQSYFGFKLVGLVSKDAWIQFCGAALFVFSPPMLWRINTPAGTHAALVSHFLILIALFLIFRNSSKYRSAFWIALLCFSTLIHFYLLAIVAILWISDLADRSHYQKLLNSKLVIREIVLAGVLVGATAFQAGYFSIATSASSDWGYGFFRMNLLAPFDPAGWSYMLKDIPMESTWGEGYSYLGLGVLFGLTFFLAGAFSSKVKIFGVAKKHKFFLLALLIMTLFAVTNHVSIGPFNYSITLPAPVIQFANVLRSPARLFWPGYYFLILVIIYGITRWYTRSQSAVILTILFLLQVFDTSAGWLPMRKTLAMDSTIESSTATLKNPLWQTFSANYQKLVLVPASNKPPFWEVFANFAAKHKMATNSVHMARIDANKQAASNQLLQKELVDGRLPPDAIYIIQNSWLIPAIASLGNNDLLTQIDGFNVLAPGCKAYSECKGLLMNEISFTASGFTPKINQSVSFSKSSRQSYSDYYLNSGWSYMEDWGVWSEGKKASLNIPLPMQPSSSIKLRVNALVNNTHPNQSLRILINGKLTTSITLSKSLNNLITLPISPEDLRKPYILISFEFLNPAKPKVVSENNFDNREIAIGLVSAEFQ